INRWISYLIRDFLHNHRAGPVAQTIPEPLHQVFAKIIVFIEDGNTAIGPLLQDVFGIDPTFELEIGLESHGPWEIDRISPLGPTGGDEELRHSLCIQIAMDGGVWSSAQ